MSERCVKVHRSPAHSTSSLTDNYTHPTLLCSCKASCISMDYEKKTALGHPGRRVEIKIQACAVLRDGADLSQLGCTMRECPPKHEDLVLVLGRATPRALCTEPPGSGSAIKWPNTARAVSKKNKSLHHQINRTERRKFKVILFYW